MKEKLGQEALNEMEKNNCIAFAAYKCFERVHEEHPKGMEQLLGERGSVFAALGEKEIVRAAFGVLESLLMLFSLPAIWFGILPSAATEFAGYLTHTGAFWCVG